MNALGNPPLDTDISLGRLLEPSTGSRICR
jgi:hypothetical protein